MTEPRPNFAAAKPRAVVVAEALDARIARGLSRVTARDLAGDTGYSVRTVRRALRECLALGWFVRVRAPGRRYTPRYRRGA